METLQEALAITFALVTSLPREINIIIGCILGATLLITILLSLFCDKKKEKCKKKHLKEIVEPSIGIIEDYSFNISNLIIDEHQKIDKIIANKTGIYLIFNYPKTKGKLTGDLNNEFLFIKKNKILNPLNEKNSYLKKLSINFNIPIEYLNLVIKYPKIKNIEIETNKIIKKEEDLIFNKEELIEESFLFDLSDRLYRVNRKK